MLVGGRMKNDLGMIVLENILQSPLIQNIRHQRNDRFAAAAMHQVLLDLKKLNFRLLYQQQTTRRIAGDLPAQFAANAPAGARHHHHAIP